MGQLLSVVEEPAETVCLEPPDDSRRCKACQEGTVAVQRQLSLRLLLNSIGVQHRWSGSVKLLLRNWPHACCHSRVMAAATARCGRLRIGGAPAWSRQSLLSTRLHHASQSWRSEVHGGPAGRARRGSARRSGARWVISSDSRAPCPINPNPNPLPQPRSTQKTTPTTPGCVFAVGHCVCTRTATHWFSLASKASPRVSPRKAQEGMQQT